MGSPNVVDVPLKIRRNYGPSEDGSSRCPYCLEKLNTLREDSSAGIFCPLCRHNIPLTILGMPPHALNRAQEWDYLVNDLDYLLAGERNDVDSYIFAMGEYYNPDYMEAKDRFMRKLFEKHALVRLKEEFLEAEGEMETLMAQYLRHRGGEESGLGGLLLSGAKWRQWARGLSAEGAGPRLIAEFQLDYVRHLCWGVFATLRKYEETILYLKERLDQLDQP